MNKNLLSPKRIGQIYGYCLRALAEDRQKGRGLPFIRVKNRVFYDQTEVEKIISNQAKLIFRSGETSA